jgi:hypothetical protein
MIGCSGPPSQSIGEKLLEKRIESQSGARIKLVSFKKTNGVENVNLYEMEYEAEIEFTGTGTWTRGSSLDSSVSFEFSAGTLPKNNLAQLMGSAIGAVNVSQGEHQTVKGMLRFQKTEQGWRGEDGQVY